MRRKPYSILPGFYPALAYTVLYLAVIVLLPLAGLFLKSAQLSPARFVEVVTSPRVVAALALSFGTSFAAAAAMVPFGLLVAWVLVRYDFPGKKLADAVVDLPFALPTAVAGITLTTLVSANGWVGRVLEPLGIKLAYTPAGISLALAFIGLPFIVRTLQPVLEDVEVEVEEAASSLGAGRLQTFRHVVFPAIRPALLTGFTLAFARGVGEYGSVVFIAGNMPGKTEIAPLLIVTKLEQYEYAEATAIAVAMLSLSFLFLLAANLLQRRQRRYV
jgi:sulfate transport system permease protein